VAVSGARAYLGAGRTFVVLDLSGGGAPALVGSVDLPDTIAMIAVQGDYAFVAAYWAGLQVVDVSVPSHPTIVGSYNTPAQSLGLALGPSVAFVADQNSLQVVNIANPAQPSLLASYGNGQYYGGIAYSAGRLYLQDYSVMRILDVSNPALPALLGSLSLSQSVSGIAISGTTAYLAIGVAGLAVVDVATASSPQLLGSLALGGNSVDVALYENFALVAATSFGLHIVDVTSATSPSHVATYNTPGRAWSVARTTNGALVADNSYGLRRLSLAVPAAPVLLGVYPVTGESTAIARTGSLAVVADTALGIRVLSVADPATPSPLGALQVAGGVRGLGVTGNYVYALTNWGELKVVSIATPSNPTLVASLPLPLNTRAIVISGSFAFVAAQSEGVLILSTSNPAEPAVVGALGTAGAAYDVAVGGQRAYVATLAGLEVWDIHNPLLPYLLGASAVVGTTVEVMGTTAYVSAGGPLSILDVSDPQQVTLLGTYSPSGNVLDMVARPGLLYLANVPFGLEALLVSDPGSPILLASYSAPVSAAMNGSLAQFGHELFLAGGEGGFSVVSIEGCLASPPSWVALGDSYSSGEGAESYLIDRNEDGDYLDPGENTDFEICNASAGSECTERLQNLCHRSERSFAHTAAYSHLIGYAGFIAESFQACSGATTQNVRSALHDGRPQEFHGWPYVATDDVPQLDQQEFPEAGMVTITIGGNDAHFAEVMRHCYLQSDCQSAEYSEGLTWEAWLSATIAQDVRASVTDTLRDICGRFPGATLYLLGYPRLFPRNGPAASCSNDYFNGDDILFAWTPNEQEWLNAVADQLNAVLASVAAEVGAYFVDVVDAGFFEGHEICGADAPFMTAPTSVLDFAPHRRVQELFHPNAAGQVLGIRRSLMAFMQEHPPGGTGAPQCQVLVPAVGDEDSTIGDLGQSETVVDAGPTGTTLRVKATAICGRNYFSPLQPLRLSGDGFAAWSVVAFDLLTGTSIIPLGAAQTDAEGSFSAIVPLPAGSVAGTLAMLRGAGTGANGHQRVALAPIEIGPSSGTDSDGDGIEDACDLCPNVSDPGQDDSDGDGLGDACDACAFDAQNDGDGDGICDSSDDCPFDPTNDGDLDGLCGGDSDNCPFVFNPTQDDSDFDLVGDACDQFPGLPDILGIFADGFESADTCRWFLPTCG